MVYDNIILLLACKEAVKRALSRTERTDFTDRKGGFHCGIGKLLAYEIKVLISLTGTMLLEYGF